MSHRGSGGSSSSSSSSSGWAVQDALVPAAAADSDETAEQSQQAAARRANGHSATAAVGQRDIAAADGDGDEGAHYVFLRTEPPPPSDGAASSAAASAAASLLPSLTPKRRHLSGGSRSPSASASPSPSPSSRTNIVGPQAGRARGGGGSGSSSNSSSPRPSQSPSHAPAAAIHALANSRAVSQGGEVATLSQVGFADDSDAAPVRVHVQAADDNDEAEAQRLLTSEADQLVLEAADADSAAAFGAASSSSALSFPLRWYANYQARLMSFHSASRWPHSAATHPHLSPESLARAGLFLAQNSVDAGASLGESYPPDTVVCYACGANMSEWEGDDRAEESHRQAQVQTLVACPFLYQLDRVRAQQGITFESYRPVTAPRYVPGSGASASALPSRPFAVAASSSSGLEMARQPSRTLQMLLTDADDSKQPAQPLHLGSWQPSSFDDADSDELPPLQSSTGLPAGLARTHSVAERAQIEIVETSEQRRRAVLATRGDAVHVQGLRVEKCDPALPDAEEAAAEPVTVQVRTPLRPFAPEEFGASAERSLLYFQVRVLHLTNTPAPAPASPASVSAGGAAAAPSTSFPPLVIGLSTTPLHAHSLPPGYEPPVSSLLNLGLCSQGDLLLNGQGPLSGVVGMQNIPFWNYSPPAAPAPAAAAVSPVVERVPGADHVVDVLPAAAPPAGPGSGSGSGSAWGPGDVVGCKVDLEKGVIYWHVNGTHLGPVVIPLPPATAAAAADCAMGSPTAASSSASASSPAASRAALGCYRFYPTVSLLHAGDAVEIELVADLPAQPTWGSAGAETAFASMSPENIDGSLRQSLLAGSDAEEDEGKAGAGARALLQRWALPSAEEMVAGATAALAGRAPDLGLVLDQTNAAKARSGTVAESPSSSTPRGRHGTVASVSPLLDPPPSGAAGAAYPVVISRILDGYAAGLAGLRVGDVLRSINGARIDVLKDAVNVVVKCPPASVLHMQVLRGSGASAHVFAVPLTLGAKLMDQRELVRHARWLHWQRGLLEWIGPPATLPPLAGALSTVRASSSPSSGALSARNARAVAAAAAAAALEGLPAPPSYPSNPQRPWGSSAVEHVKAMEVALVIEARLGNLSRDMARGSLYLPEYRSLEKRVSSFDAQMQSWMAPMAAADSSSSSSSSSSSAAAAAAAAPPKPINVALHGFCYAPLVGFPARCICFSCGLVLPAVRSVAGLLESHRLGARLAKQAALASSTPAMARPPSYRREEAASLLPANLDTGCLFLTMYDSVTASMAEVRRMRKQHSTKAPGAAAAPPVQVVIDVEAEDSQTHGVGDATGGDSDALVVRGVPYSSSSSGVNTPVGSRNAPASGRVGARGMLVPNEDCLARPPNGGGAAVALRGAAVSTMAAAASSSPLSARSPSAPPPDYLSQASDRPIPVGPDAALYARPAPSAGLFYQSKVQASILAARVGEHSMGAVRVQGRPQLSGQDVRLRNRGRERGGGGGGDDPAARHVDFRGDGDQRNLNQQYDEVEMGLRHLIALEGQRQNDPPAPPPPPADPVQVLKDFFFAGSLFNLLWKVPFFLLILPFFLVYEAVRGAFNGAVWLCKACCDAVERCCGCVGRACEKCWNFICCTVLCDLICASLCDCCKWVGHKLDEYCCTPLGQCCSWMGRQVSACCGWANRTCLQPVVRAISRCCKAIGRCISAVCQAISDCCSAVCDAIGRCCSAICDSLSRCCSWICTSIGECCSAMCNAIGRCCSWFWTPICEAVGTCLRAVWHCVSAVCDALYRAVSAVCTAVYECMAWVCNGVYRCMACICGAIYDCMAAICSAVGRCVSAVCEAVASCCSWVWRGVSRCCSAICHALDQCCATIWRCVNWAIIQPIKWVCITVYRCVRVCVEYIIIKPIKGQNESEEKHDLWVRGCCSRRFKPIWAGLCAIASFIWTSILTPIGQCIGWVGSAIGSCVSAVASAVWAVLAAIGNAIGAVFGAIYSGVFKPIGSAIASAGRAVRGLCRN